jgi:hypothetical protein
MDSAFDSLPILPHENVADVDCCGCLIIRTRQDQADIVCNECGALILTVALGEVEATMLELAQTDTVCSARCPHCGALNIFPGISAIEAFICRECAEGVVVPPSVQ